jgi:hypothetical protein
VAPVLPYLKAGLRFDIMTIDGEQPVSDQHYQILARFQENHRFTRLLVLDGDVFLPAAGLQRLVSQHVDVIAAPVPSKEASTGREVVLGGGCSVGAVGPLHEMNRIGSAAVLLSRRAVDDLAAEAGPLASLGGVQHGVVPFGVVGGAEFCEDYWLCDRLRALGHRLSADPEVITRRSGVMGC